MRHFSAEGHQYQEISDAGPGMDAPLWLLQKDDSRFLYFSLILSVTVHIILFAIMAATRIFHPFAGASQEFDLVWFSPAPAAAPMESATAKAAVARHVKTRKAHKAPATETRPSTVPAVKTKTRPTPPAETKSLPANNPPQTPAATAQLQTSREAPIDEPSEMVITRYEGKVVEIVDKKAEIPAFTVISSVKVKSESVRAVVQTIRETGKETPQTQKTRQKTKPAEGTIAAALPREGPAGKREGAATVASAPVGQTGRKQDIIQGKPIQGIASSSSTAAAAKPPLEYNRSIHSLVAALEALSATGSTLSEKTQAPQSPANGTTVSTTTATLQDHSETTAPASKPAVDKPAATEVKQAAQLPAPPRLILQPPIAGDLKLVITGDADVTVEAFFRPFPKNRRSKPFTRREAESRRSVLPKMVRTKENVHEAVVEIAEEGIYTILVRTGNGKPGSAGFVLKIRESLPGAATKNIGSRKIDGTIEVAKILMPEGILWNDDSSFTGNMEDSESITKFDAGTGLVWREYK
jgi:hypothetical protein